MNRVGKMCSTSELEGFVPLSSKSRTFYKFPKSVFPVEEAAEEYDVVYGEVSDGDDEDSEDEIESSDSGEVLNIEESRRQRVEKLRDEVREFGDGIIDANELASIYSFRIDKFQRLSIQAFLRGSSVVVSAPTSSGKTLIAEAAAVATVARRRKLLDQIEPTGWKEFLQLAAVCGSLVSEGIRLRPWKNNSFVYEPSTTVLNVIDLLEEQKKLTSRASGKAWSKYSLLLG
ncbi:hypothetical protein K7X08_006446 [Anisodus acutangulus]|uniref:DEAD/DEAH-box helicase domain-containing protein n=1 Tax=Anisodus acutangulus TaxID=402998 RepID=A0A9Q1MVC2_9SOLA|nr:hypothetical protein K7X08_006446 [Anisodus acutangulus]